MRMPNEKSPTAFELGGCWGLSLAGAATSIIFVATKHVFFLSFFLCFFWFLVFWWRFCLFCDKLTTCLSWQNTSFVATKVCHDKKYFVTTNINLSRQKTFCRGKQRSVATNTCLSRQKYALPRQNWYLWQLRPMIGVCVGGGGGRVGGVVAGGGVGGGGNAAAR